MDLTSIKSRIDSVYDNIQKSCKVAGRSFESITVLAVTKYSGEEDVQKCLADGRISHIGESKVQDAVRKYGKERGGMLPKEVELHCIGTLQSNKVALATKVFHTIQSVDRMKVIPLLNHCAEKMQKILKVFIQYKSSVAQEKQGFESFHDVERASTLIKDMPHLHLEGIMTIAEHNADTERIRECFRDTRRIRDKINTKEQRDMVLSMGMTNDYTIAIEEGSDMLRIGSGIFGEKKIQ